MTRMPGWGRRAIRWTIGTVAALIIVLALVVSVGRQLIPLVAEYRADVEAKIVETTGIPTHIGTLQGDWHGLVPRIVATDVQVGDGENPIRIDAVAMRLDALGSVLGGSLKLSSIELQGIHLALRETEDGRWQVDGLPVRNDEPFDPARVVDALSRVGLIAVRNAQLTLQPQGAEPVVLSYIDVALHGGSGEQRLDGRMNLPNGAPLSLSVRGQLALDDLRQSRARIYASLPQADWAEWIPTRLTQDYRVQTLKAGAELWLNWDKGSADHAVVRLNAGDIDVGRDGVSPADIKDLSVTAFLDRVEAGYQIQINDLAATLGGDRWGGVDMMIRQHPRHADEPSAWTVAVDRLDLAPLTPLALAVAPLPKAAYEAVKAIAPHGVLRNINARFTPSAAPESRLQVSANLERVGFGAFHGAPAAENVSGSVRGGLDRGTLDVDSDDFMLHLADLFPRPWHYDHAGGRLTWTFDDDAFTLVGHYLRVEGPVGRAAGDFLIRLKRDHDQESYMDLRVGLRDGDASHTPDYIPTRAPAMDAQLSEWLTTAIQGGRVDEGYFQYQGSLKKASPATARRMNLYAKVRDAELEYQKGWPLLHETAGEVFVEDTHVRVTAPYGRVLESRVNDVDVDIAKAADGIVHLKLKGQVDGSLSDGLKTLRGAPIPAAKLFTDWRGNGPLKGDLDLDIPFRKNVPPRVIANFETRGATFSIKDPDLELEQLAGRFRFDSERGLSSPEVTGSVLGQLFKGRLLAQGTDGQIRTRIEATGEMPVERITQWLKFDRPIPASGRVPYLLALNLGESGSELSVDSTLEGTVIDLPAPFGKQASEARPGKFRMTLGAPEQRFWAGYDDQASLSLALPENDWSKARGELRLGGGQAGLPNAMGMLITGSIDDADLSDWQAINQRYAGGTSVSSADNGAPSQPDSRLLRRVDLRFQHLRAFGQDAQNARLTVTREPSRWLIGLDSSLAVGTAAVPDGAEIPIEIALSRLQLPPAEPVADTGVPAPDRPDPLEDFAPTDLPPLNVRIDRLAQGGDVLGAWSFNARPASDGARFDNLDLELKKGLKLTGALDWTGKAGSTSTAYQGRLDGRNLSEVLLAWGFAPTATSEDFRLEVKGSWPGSPAAVSLKGFSGQMDARLRRGAFVEVEGSASALRVFGLLNFNAIGRRLRLDFSDLLGRGLAYDEVKGTLNATRGIYVTANPITLNGPSSNIQIDGKLDMVTERIDADMTVALPLTNNLPLAALIVGAPAIGGALFVVDRLLGDRVSRMASVHYKVEGPLRDPKMTFERP